MSTDDLDEYIALARAGNASLSADEQRANYNHRKYLEIKAKDPDYYTKRAREARRSRRMTTGIKREPIKPRSES